MIKNRKKEIIIIVCILLLLLLGLGGFFLMQNMNKKTTLTSDWDISWYDENEEEYVITTKEQLFGFAELSQTIDFAGKTIKLGNDIDVNKGNAEDWSKKVPELIWTPAVNFAGTFDGQGHTLSGLFIDVAGGGAGLFADTQEDSVIKDFKLLNTYVYSQTSKGTGSISSGGGGTFERIYTDAIIECNGFYCGGIIGTMRDGVSINECWFDGEITIEGSCAGGIAAALADGDAEMNHCLNTGLVKSTYPGPDAAMLGGLCGAVSKTLELEDCLNVGTIVSEEDLAQVGSLFGTVSGGTVEIDSIWTMKESAKTAVGYAKTGLNGLWGERTQNNLTGFLGYQKTDLDFENYWAVVEEGTPILKYFADKVPEIPELERAMVADLSWYNTQKKEYVIRTAEELLGLARFTAQGYGNRFTDKKVRLENDIIFNEGDAKDFAKEEPLNEWTPIYNFTGTFDGKGHTISGLYGSTIEGTTTGMGLFSGTREMTVIENLQLTNSYFTTVTAHGLAAISSRGTGTFKNIYVDAILVSQEQGSIGGILGMATKDGATIENCWSDCDITSGGRRAGGILGNGNGKSKVSIKHCLNTGKLTRSFKGLAADNKLRTQSSLFGGIIGGTGTGSKGDYKGDFTLEDCLNVGLLQSDRENDGLGGVAGTTTGNTFDGKPTVTVKNCYCSETSCAKVIGGKNSETVVYDCVRLNDEMLIGAEAYFYTSLNFKEYWAALSGKTPVLKTFASGKGKTLAVSGERSDISWYTPGKKEYSIKTAAQLYGFARLAFGGEKFEGVTIKLGADIVLNSGNASEWVAGTAKAGRAWTPIKNFGGTFDGQGHSISGLYGIATGVHEDRAGMGLFVETRDTAVIQNVSIKNSYFESTYANGVGAVSGRGGGTFKNIYVSDDVYLQNKLCGSVGAIVGITTKTTTVENCWSAATITASGQGVGGIVGNGNAQTVTIKHCLNTGTITRSFEGLTESLKLYDYAKYPSYYKDTTEAAGYFGGIIGRTGGGKKGAYTGTFVIEDCLSVGTIVSERQKDATGGIAGQTTGNKEDGKPTVTIANSYCTESSCTKVIASQNSETNVTDTVRMPDAMLVGTDAYYYTGLNFDTYWAAITSETPVLKTFATTGVIAVSGARTDISWYTSGKTEYTIKTSTELYGLARLSLGGEKFEGVTIKLGADIAVNPGNASEWVAGTSKAGRTWTPIKNFGGTFDGQGHTISGLYGIATGVHEERDGMGLFVELQDTAVIQNLTIKNSYFKSTYANGVGAVSGRGGGTFKNIYVGNDVYLQNPICGSVGAIVGITTKKTTIENCWTAATITVAGQGVGGVVGNGNSQTVTIKHCLNTGTITRSFAGMEEALASYDYAKYPSYYKDTTEAAGYFGGIIGRTGGGKKGAYTGTFVIEDCLSVGTIVSEREKDATGGIAGQTTGNKEDGKPTVTIANSYCTESSCTKVIASQNSETNVTDTVRMPDAMLMGTDAYYYTGLNFNTYWAAITAETPVLKMFATTGVVAVSGTRADISWYSKGETIMDAADLYGFVRLALSGETFKGETVKLGANITVNSGLSSDWAAGNKLPGRTWTPIQNFGGTFDGQGYSISGLYGVATGYHADRDGMGLFVETKDTATVQNLIVSNSYFESTYANGLAVVAGRGGGNFKNIHIGSDVVLVNKICGSVGGVLGMATKTSTIENCWSEAKITASGQGVGGIVGNGNAQTVTIKHCLNTGTLTRSFAGLEEALKLYDYADYESYYKDTSDSAGYFGGIIGRTGGGNGTSGYTGNFVIEDCMSAGILTSERTEDANGGIAGQTTGLNKEEKATVTITNTYCTTSGSNKDIGSKNASTVLNDSKRLNDEYVTGENAYFYTALDYVGYWGIPREGTPILKTFAKASDNVIAYNGEWSDISWYNTNDISFTITDKADLYGLVRLSLNGETFEGKTITLNATESIVINEGDASKWADGTEALPENVWIPIQGFAGTFDGQNAIISGIYCKQVSETGVAGIGLFAETEGASIKNINLVNSHFAVNTSNGTGAITGQGSGTFKNVHADVIMTDTSKKGYIGGIIGKATGPVNIENCWSECDITSNYRQLGGIVADGNAQTVNIKHCLNTGDITISSGSTQTSCYTGGIIGKTGAGSESKGWTGSFVIEDCLSTGIVKTESESATGTIGSVVGYATGANDDVETVVISNTYGAVNYDEEGQLVGVDKAIGSDYRKTKTGCSAVEDSKLVGVNAFYNTELDFVTTSNTDGYWKVRKDAVPMLKDFWTQSDTAIEVSGLVKDATEFSLNTKNEGFITNLEQLKDFRDEMNNGTSEVSSNTEITLTRDIVVNSGNAKAWANGSATLPKAWIPISGFTGTFDGGGHTISGLYGTYESSQGVTGTGLFTKTNGVTIQNLSVRNSYFKVSTSNGTGAIVGQGNGIIQNVFVDAIINDTRASGDSCIGAILGKADGAVKVSNCWSMGEIESSLDKVGGIVGDCNGKDVTISYCLNTGDITCHFEGACFYGGLVGRTASTGILQITNSLSTGIVSSTTEVTRMAALLGYANGDTTISDTYGAIHYDKDGKELGVSKAVDNKTMAGTKMVSHSDLLGNSALTKASTLDYVSETNTDGFWIVRDGKTPMLTYFIKLSKAVDEEIERKTFTLVENKGTISNLDQLEDFRDKMNAGTLAVNKDTLVTLTDDIEMNEGWTANSTRPAYEWIPIVGYPGTFDGGGKTISSVYVRSNSGITGIGLFTGTADTTIIKNLNVTNSHFRGNSGNGTGAIVGTGSGTFLNIFVQAEVYDKDLKGNLGGILGKATGTVLVENCWTDCEIKSDYINLGGIVGNADAKSVTIRHCLSTSNITISNNPDKNQASNGYTGGIIGKTGSGSGTTGCSGNVNIEDCLSTGVVKTESSKTKSAIGGIVGWATGLNGENKETVTIKNSYSAINYNEGNIVGTATIVGKNQGALVENCDAIDSNYLLGELAGTYAPALDYVSDANPDGLWTTRTGKIPMLISFLELSNTIDAQ